MARSLQEIMNSADEMAMEAERSPAHGLEVEPGDDPWLDLKLAAFKRAQAEKELAQAVKAARERGMSWEQIGKHLGITGEAVRRRYGDLIGLSEGASERSILLSVGKVPSGGKIGVSRLRSGKIEVSVLDRQGHTVRKIRKPQVAIAIARKKSIVVRGERILIERRKTD